MTGPILVINPNSDPVVTAGVRDALARYALPAGPMFECVDLPQNPATIATAEDVAVAGLGVLALARQRRDASAIITACFSDPGIDLLRADNHVPAFGIQEAGVLTALARADLFGIIALSPRSIPRHRVKLRQMAVLDRLAGEVGLSGVSARDAGTSDAVFAETVLAGQTLVSQGAGAIVLGCAGFAPRRAALERELGVAVIDPVQAAAVMALGAVMG